MRLPDGPRLPLVAPAGEGGCFDLSRFDGAIASSRRRLAKNASRAEVGSGSLFTQV